MKQKKPKEFKEKQKNKLDESVKKPKKQNVL